MDTEMTVPLTGAVGLEMGFAADVVTAVEAGVFGTVPSAFCLFEVF
jgi:hypothetical protein